MARAMAVEKIVAVARIYSALLDELAPILQTQDIEPSIHSVILDAAVKIALSTDTKDLGILGMDNPLRLDNLDGTTSTTVTDLAKGDHYAGMPGDADH